MHTPLLTMCFVHPSTVHSRFFLALFFFGGVAVGGFCSLSSSFSSLGDGSFRLLDEVVDTSFVVRIVTSGRGGGGMSASTGIQIPGIIAAVVADFR